MKRFGLNRWMSRWSLACGLLISTAAIGRADHCIAVAPTGAIVIPSTFVPSAVVPLAVAPTYIAPSTIVVEPTFFAPTIASRVRVVERRVIVTPRRRVVRIRSVCR